MEKVKILQNILILPLAAYSHPQHTLDIMEEERDYWLSWEVFNYL